MSKLIFYKEEQPEGFNPKFEGAGVFIEVREKLLYMHRHPDKPYGETWGIPAGKIESGETPYQAAMREVKEETGIELESLSPVGTLYVRLDTYDFIFHTFYCHLETTPTILHEPDAHTACEWLTPKEALSLPLIVGGKEALHLFLTKKTTFL